MNAWDFAPYFPGMTMSAVAETPGSWLLFAPEHVVKIVKPLKRDGRDYGQLPERQKLLKEELERMKTWSPGVADKVIPLKNQDATVEVALLMRRIPRSSNLVARLITGRATVEEVQHIGRALAKVHQKAPAAPAPQGDATALLQQLEHATEPLLQPDASIFLSHDVAMRVKDRLHAMILALAPTLKERLRKKRIRRIHGNLQASNVFVETASVSFFNPVERDELAHADVLADVACIAKDVRAFMGDQGVAQFSKAYNGGVLSQAEQQLLEVHELLWVLRGFIAHTTTLAAGSGGLIDTELVQRFRRRLVLFAQPTPAAPVAHAPHPASKQHAAPVKHDAKKHEQKRGSAAKPAAKKPAPKKSAAKPGGKKPGVKKSAAKKSAPKKTTVKKAVVKKTAPKKPTLKKASARKPAAKKSMSKKPAPGKTITQRLKTFLGMKKGKRR